MMKKRIVKISLWFIGILMSIFLLISSGIYFFKDEICGVVIQEINKNLKAQVAVSEVDLTFWGTFPKLAVDFNQVLIKDTYKNYTGKDTLLYSDQIRLKFNVKDIWNEKYVVQSIEVDPGTLKMKVSPNGEINYEIFKEKNSDTVSGFNFKLENVHLENFRFSYQNQAIQQSYKTHIDELDLTGDFSEKKFTLHAKTTAKINKAKSKNVTLISNKSIQFDLDLLVDQVKNTVTFPVSTIQIANLPFTFKGAVSSENYAFEIHSKDIELTDIANNFKNEAVDNINHYEGKGTVYFDLFIDGKRATDAASEITCDFGIQHGSLKEKENNIKINAIGLKGSYRSNRAAEKEFLRLTNIHFNSIGGPFSGALLITNFDNPTYKGNAKGSIHLKTLHTLFNLPYIEKIFGDVGITTQFDIQTVHLKNGKKDFEIRACEGQIELKHVGLKLKNDKRYFNDMNGIMYLRNDEAGIENVRLSIGKSDLAIDGIFKNIVPFFKNKGNLIADVSIQGNFIDVQDLGTTTKKEKIQDARNFVLPNTIDATLQLNVGALKYEKHTFNQVNGSLIMRNRNLYFPAISLQTAGATVSGNLRIEEKNPEIFTISTNLAGNNIHFKPLFVEWENFHQKVINENNISGTAAASVYFEAPFDLKSGIVSSAIKAQVQLKIVDGRLKGVEAFKAITESLNTTTAKLLIGKENIESFGQKLNDLKFETLENTFIIQNGQLEIPEMVIKSSALELKTAGTHSFSNNVDYRFAFNLRAIKARAKMTEFGEEEDDGTGMIVFMRMKGQIDNPKITWDKDAKREQARLNREAERQTVKSMLKTEFGLFGKDSTVKIYQPKEMPKEVLKVEFGNQKTDDPVIDNKPKKDSKIKNKLKNWKTESTKEKEEEIELN